MQKGLEDMQKSQKETKNELKERMENRQRSQEETKERMEKGQEDLRNTLEKKIDSVKEKIALKVEEKIVVVEEKMEKKVEEKIETIREELAGNFSLMSQRVEDLEKKLLASGNATNKSKFVPVSSGHVPSSALPLTSSPVSVKLSTYEGKTNWEVYKTQFSIISEANGWTEGVKACQLAASLRGETAEILQTLPDTERLNLKSLYNALYLRFGQKYTKDYARLQMKTRHQKTGESLQEYASEYFVDGLKDGEIQKAVRKADVQDLKFSLLYALELEAATQDSRRDHQSIQRARVTLDAPCVSPWKSDIEKLRDEFQSFENQRQNQEKRNFKCWGCGVTGHLRRNCPRSRKDENTVSYSKQEN
ncbi:uncharacterized protein TNCV_1137851 [Trichonephila clavipes]|nr:uncharacterized protein TNCV_1137851 [Trichonephila clavipes]